MVMMMRLTTILIAVGAVIREDAVPALNVSWDQHMLMMMVMRSQNYFKGNLWRRKIRTAVNHQVLTLGQI